VTAKVIDAVFGLFALIPLELRVLLGRFLGWVLNVVFRFRRADVDTHLSYAFPDMDDRGRAALRATAYRHMGLLMVELLSLPCMKAQKVLDLSEVTGVEHLEHARAHGKGVFVLAAHLGNWEMGLAALARHGIGSHVIVKEIKSKAGAYAADKIRGSHGATPIPRRRSLRMIARVLRDGGGVGFVLDQNTTADEGVFVQFFGRPACTMPGLAILSQRYQAPVVPIQFSRDDDLRHHRVTFFPELEWEELSRDKEANIRHNTQRYTAAIESLIRQHPDQWLWVHRRWRTRPPADSPVR